MGVGVVCGVWACVHWWVWCVVIWCVYVLCVVYVHLCIYVCVCCGVTTVRGLL